ncbi:MAG: 50S ribosomal protein L25 [Acidobacteriaceae bacterium]
MSTITLNAKLRTLLGRATKQVRRNGSLPAVIYGHGQDTKSLELNEREFLKVFKQAGESTLVSLDVEGKAVPVLIHDVQHHYLTGKPIHVDFYAVKMTEKLTATIPIHLIGEAPAVKTLGGTLVKNLSEIEVECLPADIPPFVEADLSKLNSFEDAVRVSDLKFSDKVKVLANADEMIVGVEAPRTEEELKELEEKPVAEDVTQVEGVVKPEAEGEKAAEEEKGEKKEKTKKE